MEKRGIRKRQLRGQSRRGRAADSDQRLHCYCDSSHSCWLMGEKTAADHDGASDVVEGAAAAEGSAAAEADEGAAEG